MISTKFYFDGIHSDTKGLSLIRTSGGIFDLPFVTARNIREEYPTNAIAPYHFGTQLQPQTITMAFSTLINNMTSSKLQEIASWLFQDDYKEFYSEDNPDKRYYLIATSEINFKTNGANEGYLEVQFRSKYPYALTMAATPTYTISGSGNIVINNTSNVYRYYYPELQFTVNSSSPTTITFTNTTDSNRITSFTGLSNGEIIYMNNQKRTLISSTGNYRYNSFNKNWLRLIQGINTISVSGNVSVMFRTQFPIFN